MAKASRTLEQRGRPRDPIFEIIDRTRNATAASNQAAIAHDRGDISAAKYKTQGRSVPDFLQAALDRLEQSRDAAFDAEDNAREIFVHARPTTAAGAAAKLRYAVDQQSHNPFDERHFDAILESVVAGLELTEARAAER